MTVKIRKLYSDDGFAHRDVSEYVYDPRDLDEHGKPPAHWHPQTAHEKIEGEVEFDHEPSAAELLAAFPNRAARLAAQGENDGQEADAERPGS